MNNKEIDKIKLNQIVYYLNNKNNKIGYYVVTCISKYFKNTFSTSEIEIKLILVPYKQKENKEKYKEVFYEGKNILAINDLKNIYLDTNDALFELKTNLQNKIKVVSELCIF